MKKSLKDASLASLGLVLTVCDLARKRIAIYTVSRTRLHDLRLRKRGMQMVQHARSHTLTPSIISVPSAGARGRYTGLDIYEL